MLLIQAAKVTASERLYRNKLAVALANMRESPISETRATTKGGAELKFGTQSPPAKSLQTIGSQQRSLKEIPSITSLALAALSNTSRC